MSLKCVKQGFFSVIDGQFLYQYWYEVKRRTVYKRRVIYNGHFCRPVRISRLEYVKALALKED